jgi:hypothetical protein
MMNDDLASVMSRLPDPAVPATLSATVMARIAREDDARAVVPVEVPRRAWGAWVWSIAGLMIVVGASVWGWMSAGTLPDLLAPRIGPGRQPLLPGGPAAAVIALGLFLYLAGLFAPLRGRR